MCKFCETTDQELRPKGIARCNEIVTTSAGLIDRARAPVNSLMQRTRPVSSDRAGYMQFEFIRGVPSARPCVIGIKVAAANVYMFRHFIRTSHATTSPGHAQAKTPDPSSQKHVTATQEFHQR